MRRPHLQVRGGDVVVFSGLGQVVVWIQDKREFTDAQRSGQTHRKRRRCAVSTRVDRFQVIQPVARNHFAVLDEDRVNVVQGGFRPDVFEPCGHGVGLTRVGVLWREQERSSVGKHSEVRLPL